MLMEKVIPNHITTVIMNGFNPILDYVVLVSVSTEVGESTANFTLYALGINVIIVMVK